MKLFLWDPEKNEWLKRERGISFEQVVLHIQQGDLLDILEHPNPQKYPGQRILIVRLEDYVVSRAVSGDGGRRGAEDHHSEAEADQTVFAQEE